MKIRLFPDPVLRKKSETVTRFDTALQKYLDRLTHLMKQQPMGLGISAPQVGDLCRIIIIDLSARVDKARLLWMINPVIRDSEGSVIGREGCMSIPEYTGNVQRKAEICVSWMDEFGVTRDAKFGGLEARCIQHEMDHLDGILFIDRVVSLKSDLIPRKR